MLEYIKTDDLKAIQKEALRLARKAKLYVIGLPIFNYSRTEMLTNLKELEEDLINWDLSGSKEPLDATKESLITIRDYLNSLVSR